MKNKINSIIAVLSLCATLALIVQGCKDNTPVQVNNNNNNQGPGSPVLLNPQNRTSVQTSTPVLQWGSFTNATSYRLQISLDANFAGTMELDSSGITGTQFTVPSNVLTLGAYNYWRIIASISSGTSAWSVVWKFNIVYAAPAAPILLSPPNGSTGQAFLPLFDWNDVATAQFYRIQVSRFSNFSPVVLDSSLITDSQLQCPQFILNTGTQYFWRVIASNSNGLSTGPWSSTWNFTTVTGPEPNSISGIITFVDTTFLRFPAYYYAAAYPSGSWPPPNNYSVSDSIIIQRNGNIYTANYKFSHLINGSYIICLQANNAIRLVGSVQGIYVCDTVHVQYSGCPNNPNPVLISNNNGVENINFLSWADTTKRIF